MESYPGKWGLMSRNMGGRFMEEGALVLKMRNFVPEDGALILEEILVSERGGFFPGRWRLLS